jgi:hypothetical protein
VSKPGSGNGNNLPVLSDDTVRQLATNQAREIQLRAEELALKKQTDQNQCEVAKLAIKAHAEDREKGRATFVTSRKHLYIFWGFIATASMLFIAGLLMMNKDDIVKEIIKAAVFLSAGGIAGYYKGKGQKPKSEGEQ